MIASTRLLRTARTWHRKVAAVLFVFFFIISITAVLLGWKNLFASTIYSADVKQKTTVSLNNWLPLDSLKHLAILELHLKVPNVANGKPDRMDARMDKGYVRFSFSNSYNVQLNAQTGALQSIDKKAPEWILRLHDGEIADDLFNIKNGAIKKTYTTAMGLALLFLTMSGFWMWYKPKQIKNAKRNVRNS